MTRRSWEGILCILLWWIQVCHLVILCPFFWILDTALLFGSLRLSSFLLYFYLRPLRTWCYGRGERDCWTQLLPWCCYFTAKAENSVLCKNSLPSLSPLKTAMNSCLCLVFWCYGLILILSLKNCFLLYCTWPLVCLLQFNMSSCSLPSV
jgi:hypothetical protein